MASIDVSIKRENLNTTLKFSIDPEIEEVFKEMTEDTRESNSWPGLSYYHLPSGARSDEYMRKLGEYGLVDDFGYNIIREGKFNIAWIRTVGGEGEINIPNNVTIAQVQEWIASASRFLKHYFSEHFKDYEVKAQITINI